MKAKPAKAHFNESHHQAWCKALLHGLGFVVYDTSQGIRGAKGADGKWRSQGGTRTTPGLSDLIALHPELGLVLFFEVKPPAKATSAKNLLARVDPPMSRVKELVVARAQRDFGVLVMMCQDQHPEAVAYGYGSLPELAGVLAGHFPATTIGRWVRMIGCPREIQDRAVDVATTARGTP